MAISLLSQKDNLITFKSYLTQMHETRGFALLVKRPSSLPTFTKFYIPISIIYTLNHGINSIHFFAILGAFD